MAFPDRIERTVEIAHPPARVWAALTTAEGLSAWFGQQAAIDLRPGGSASMKWDSGHTADMRVERVEEPGVFGFTWHIFGLPEDDPRRTYVEFTLEPVGAGTRLTVIESGFAQLPDDAYRTAYDGNTQGMGERARRARRLPRCRGLTARCLTTGRPIEAIAEQVFIALADPSRRAILAALARAGRPPPPTWPAAADHPPGDRQAPGAARRGRPGDGRAG